MSDCAAETEHLLRSHNRLIHELAEVLLINETIDAEEMEIVMACYTQSRSEDVSNSDKEPENEPEFNEETLA